MTLVMARLTVFAALVAGAAPALGADWGGIRDYSTAGAGVPVPAPIPIPEFKPSWYFRFDAGLGVVSDPDISGSIDDLAGAPGDPLDPTAGPSTLNLPSWFETDFDTFLTLGGGVGYYVGNGWRLDSTVEKRSNDRVTGSGITASGDTWAYNPFPTNYEILDVAPADGAADSQSRFVINDSADLDGTVWMLNAYYDFNRGGVFTPYVGAGVGFVWNEITRNQSIQEQRCNLPAATCTNADFTPLAVATATDKAEKVSLAAAAMAGVSYSVSDMTSVDIGYRYLYLQGADALLGIGGAASRIDIGDQNVHQVRAGLRFDVD